MSARCRQWCDGGPFEHEEIVMSIARALEDSVKHRCPLCRLERTVGR